MTRFSLRLPVLMRFRPPADRELIFFALAAAAGLFGGVAALLFRLAFTAIRHLFDAQANGMVEVAMSLPWWGRLSLPMAGGLAAGLLMKFGLDWVQRRGADDYLEAITLGDGVLSMRQTLIKTLASLCSISTGASIGREGSMVQLAAMTASVLGRVIKLPRRELQILVACGATAGITSAYNAPIAGAIFVIEIAIGSLSKEILAPLIISSVIANIVARGFFGLSAVYQMPHFTPIAGWEVLAYIGLGIICGFTAPLFRWTLDFARRSFIRLPTGLVVNMALGGLGVGLISIWEPRVWGNGYAVVNSVLHDPWSWQMLLVVLILKVIATALCSGSGAIGGVFTPTLFVGAVLGALYGHLMVGISSLSDLSVISYTMIGMGAFLASVTYAPLMCILMIFEMTLSYEAILPLMLACVIGHHIAHRLRPHSIYNQRDESHGIGHPDPETMLRSG